VFRSPGGRRYAGSTLESADDLRALTDLLSEFRGGDGFPPVWQANTIVASPDYARLTPPAFDVERLPIVEFPSVPPRWMRPRLWEQLTISRMSGVWWPELHGLHHLPERAWLTALQKGESDARRAHEHQSPVCRAVDASGEYHAAEPEDVRSRNIETAIAAFRRLFARLPGSLCPPDYRWNERLEADAERLGVTTIQGKGEQLGVSFARARRLILHYRWPNAAGARFYMPPRIAFEPSRGGAAGTGPHVEAALRAARAAWGRGQPAIVSTHRVNYVHLDAVSAEGGRLALRDLLAKLAAENAVFLVDREVRELEERAWSLREIGTRGVLVRYCGVPGEPIRFAAPSDATGATIREGRGDGDVRYDHGEVEARLNDGEYLLEWERA
jgi:hypothetical protein